ncbi:MAG TPA: hypothetical protein VMT53_11985 [Terriglobales bacterium]|nr:hypothetical protein [Terriglobales bacterium]
MFITWICPSITEPTAIVRALRFLMNGRLVRLAELWKGLATFFEHGQRKGAYVRILTLNSSYEFTAGILFSVPAPHHPT